MVERKLSKERLKNYKDFSIRIKMLEDEIQSLNDSLGRVSDVVTGSSLEYPHTKTVFSVSGVSTDIEKRSILRIKRITKRLDETKELAQKSYEDILWALLEIEDPIISEAIRLKFLKDFSWGKAAQEIGGKNTADGLRMAVERYLK